MWRYGGRGHSQEQWQEKILERRGRVDWGEPMCQARDFGHIPGVKGKDGIRLLERTLRRQWSRG